MTVTCPHCGGEVPVRGDWSVETHGHFFARLQELFDNLPEHRASHFKNIHHFRAWCLIHEGYCNEAILVEPTHAQALETAAKFTKALRKITPYAVVQVEGTIVYAWTARSQARHGGMSKKEWGEAKQKVLELAEHLVNGGELAA